VFDVGVPELLLVLMVVLLVFGPGKLPEIGSALGRSLKEFRQATRDVPDGEKSNKPEPKIKSRP
jgi:sec-independent protein translocase protein TatA